MTPKKPRLRLCACAALLAVAANQVQAVDWNGYFRAGPGSTKSGASRACYGLDGPGLKYRLGNECDFYGEFLVSQSFKNDGVDYKAGLMTYLWEGNTNGDTERVGINQMYVEGTGYDIAPTATFWAGKRFYGLADVHIVDTHFTKMSGVGAGVMNLDAGVGKLAIAYFKTDADAVKSGNRINIELNNVPANADGKLRFIGTLTEGHFSGGKRGAGFTVQHNQDKFLGLGGSNTLWLQAAQGSANINGNFGDLSAGSDVKSWRVIESFTWQQGPFGGQALALWQQDRSNTNGKLRSASVGGRASYALTRNFKLVGELGHSQQKPQGAATAKLTKLTLAPTLSTGPDFWNRPELRLYVTTARWNDAAGNLTGQSAFAGQTHGTSFGAQAEIWF